MSVSSSVAPPLQILKWINTTESITLEKLRGKVVLLHAFQMLCPGCVKHAIPQAKAMHRLLPNDKAVVLGIHTVFEHHDAMGEVPLRAFVQQYGIHFPVGIDQPSPTGAVPLTMREYGLDGTPSLIIIDKAGRIRDHRFGAVSDLELGVTVGLLLNEPDTSDGKTG